jgi:hypothetical protein
MIWQIYQKIPEYTVSGGTALLCTDADEGTLNRVQVCFLLQE